MNKTIIIIKDLVPGTLTNADAMALFVCMDNAFSKGDTVVLSFNEIHSLTTSFLNSSIGEIIDKYGFETLKGRLSLKDYTPSVAKLVTQYISDIKATKSL